MATVEPGMSDLTGGGGSDGLLIPLGARELVPGWLLVGTTAIDLGRGLLPAVTSGLGGGPLPPLVIVEPLGPDVPAEASALPTGCHTALRIPLSMLSAGGAPQVWAAAEQTARVHGIEGFDLLLLDGADPFRHPAHVAEAAHGAVERGLATAIGISGHTLGQARALLAHLAPDCHVAAIEAPLAEVTVAALTEGWFDLALEIGAVPIVPVHAALCRDGEPRVDAAALAVVLHHPARPILQVDLSDLSSRVLAAEAASMPLGIDDLRRLVR